MIKAYFKDLFKRFKEKSLFTKIILGLFIAIEIFILVICFGKTKYDITTPGSVDEANQTITVNTTNNSGHILTVSVSDFTKASIVQYWLAKGDERFAIEENDESVITNKDYNTYSVILKRMSINSSIILAYEKAKELDDSIYLDKTFEGVRIYYLKKDIVDLKLNDLITQVEGVSFTTLQEFNTEINKLLGEDRKGGLKQAGDSIEFTIIRDGVEMKRSGEIKDNDGRLSIGMNVIESFVLNGTNSNPQFTVKYNEVFDASGSSGGAMMALSVYNALLSEDITHGLFIAGTGTIDRFGNVGAIGAIEQKTIEVFTKGLDLFFVDNEKYNDDPTDYELAIATAKKFGYDESKIIPVNTFDDIINYLKGLGD